MGQRLTKRGKSRVDRTGVVVGVRGVGKGGSQKKKGGNKGVEKTMSLGGEKGREGGGGGRGLYKLGVKKMDRTIRKSLRYKEKTCLEENKESRS